MFEFTIDTEIERPVTDVFAYVADPTKLSIWQANTISVTQEGNGPLRVGTQLREIHRLPDGRELESLVEVTELEPERKLSARTLEGPLPLDAYFSFAPTEAGTLLTFKASCQPTGTLRFAQRLLRRGLAHQFGNYCTTLKQLLEAEA